MKTGDKKAGHKNWVSGKGRIILLAALLLTGVFLSFVINPSSYTFTSRGGQQTGETIVYKSSLVWRTDGKGDYLLPELSSNAVHELVNAVETDKPIKAITATWKFEGKAALEVSADNGKNYVSVVNGVPIQATGYRLQATDKDVQKQGFVSGRKLKWRVTLGPDSRISEIKIAYTNIEEAGSTFGSPELSGFKFRKAIEISNPSGEELFNYQVRIKVGEGSHKSQEADVYCQGNIKSDFKDIRFTAQDGETSLPYYLENITGERPDRVATFWVKVPQIPPDGVRIYIYYGNPEAEDLSNGEAVFDFFDDFRGDSLDWDKWEKAGESGTAAVTVGQLKLEGAELHSKTYQFKDGIIEYQAKAGTGNEIRFILRGQKNILESAGQLVYSSSYGGAEHCIAVGGIVKANQAQAITSGTTYDYRVIAKGENITFERYLPASGSRLPEADFSTLEASVSYKDEGGLKRGFLGLKAGSESTSYFDWVRVRKYAEAEPYISASGDEETVSLAEFSQTTVAADGDVVLDSTEGVYSLSGQYTTAPVCTACNITAITPTVKVTSHKSQVISLDISADGGLNWRKGCESGRTYTAPFDFTPGRELLLRINLSTEDANTTPEIEELKLDYSLAPIVTSANIHCSGATGLDGTYIAGDTVTVQWDNSSQGDNNPDIVSVSCDLTPFGGPQIKMNDADNDNIYTCHYKLPQGINKTANIFITVTNHCGIAVRNGHILSVDTRSEDRGQKTEKEKEEEKEKEVEVDLGKLIREGRRPGTELYDILIKLGDNHNPDPQEDARACYKEGDVVLVKPAGHNWSETERRSFLIIQAYLTEEEARNLTKPKEIATGRVDEDGRPVIKILRRRAGFLNLKKLGLDKVERGLKLRDIRKKLKGKRLKWEAFEEKEQEAGIKSKKPKPASFYRKK